VSEALDRLPEALRLPLVLRYFQKLGYAEIAEVLGCPVGSVSGRLREGQESLRKALPAALGIALLAEVDLEQALGAVPLVPLPATLGLSLGALGQGSAVIVKGGLIMSLKSKGALGVAALLLLLIGGAGFVQARLRDSSPSPASVDVSSRISGPAKSVPAIPEGLPTGIQPGKPEKEGPSLPKPASEPQAAFESASAEILVKVRDPQGSPAQGVKVCCNFHAKKEGEGSDEELTQRSDAAGEAKVKVPEHLLGRAYALSVGLSSLEGREEEDVPWGCFQVDDPQAPLGPGERREHEVVVKPALLLCVEIHGSDGRQVEGHLRIELASCVERGFCAGGLGMPLLPSHEIWLMDPVPEDCLQITSTTHRETARLPILGFPRTGNRIEARITLEPGACIEGQVVMADASPCRKGTVSFWPGDDPDPEQCGEYVPLDEEGRFSIGGLSSEVPFYTLQVVALAKGDMCGLPVALPKRVKAAPGQKLLITLEEGQSISGRVLDGEGAPVEDASLFVRGPGGRHYALNLKTDKEGRFEIKGLPEGDFQIRAFQSGISSCTFGPDGEIDTSIDGERKTLSPVGWEKVPSGTRGLEIVLRPGEGMKPYR
jgi:hypothetical protein